MSESDVFEGENLFSVDIHVAAQKIAEREHPMVFRLQESGRTAVVEPRNDWSNPLLDAVFGTRDTSDSPIQEYFDLERREATILPRQVDIRNDLRPEDVSQFIYSMLTFLVAVPVNFSVVMKMTLVLPTTSARQPFAFWMMMVSLEI